MAEFSPYEESGGTILAIAGEGFSLVASDTRLSTGFQIHTRQFPKIFELTPHTLLGACGYCGDVLTVVKMIQSRVKLYDYEIGRKISTAAVASMLSKMQYYRRFFPYYTYNIVVGLDDAGNGAVYSFDPIGSYEREQWRCGGSASSLIQSFLDCQLGYRNQTTAPDDRPDLTPERAVTLAHDAFIGAAERDIYTGDEVCIAVITPAGIEYKKFPLRKD